MHVGGRIRKPRVQVMFNHEETNVQSPVQSACVSPQGAGRREKVCLLWIWRRGGVVPSVAEGIVNEEADEEWCSEGNYQTHETKVGPIVSLDQDWRDRKQLYSACTLQLNQRVASQDQLHQNKPFVPRMAAWLKWELLLNSWVGVSISVPAYESHLCALYQTSSIAATHALNQFMCMWQRMLISKSTRQGRFLVSALH